MEENPSKKTKNGKRSLCIAPFISLLSQHAWASNLLWKEFDWRTWLNWLYLSLGSVHPFGIFLLFFLTYSKLYDVLLTFCMKNRKKWQIQTYILLEKSQAWQNSNVDDCKTATFQSINGFLEYLYNWLINQPKYQYWYAIVITRKYPLCGYILDGLMHTSARD